MLIVEGRDAGYNCLTQATTPEEGCSGNSPDGGMERIMGIESS
jgi:hypothetical protein